MNKLLMHYEYNGETFEIWETNAMTIDEALEEMDTPPTESGWLYLKDNDGVVFAMQSINGGF